MLNMQNVKDIKITEGDVRTIHDKDDRLIWGRLAYDTKYAGNAIQNGTPTPATPVNVDVVTGTQAVTVSDGVDSEDYTISLGSIELCKIGNYQDYIYKSGDDWYVHKNISKIILDGTETGTWNLVTGSDRYSFWIHSNQIPNAITTNPTPKLCDRFIYSDKAFNGGAPIPSLCENSNAVNVLFIFNTDGTEANTVIGWRSWLSTHNTTVYYPIATPTDTEITDNTLIEQLDAIHQFLTRYGYNSNVIGNLPIIINQTSL